MSKGLQNALRLFSYLMLGGGPLVCVLVILFVMTTNTGARLGATIPAAWAIAFWGIFAGGILRTLVSIDERLERRG